MKLQVLPDQRFSCHSCSHCCRHWHVELLDAEVKAVTDLSWPEGDPLRDVKPTMLAQGRTFLAHTKDGACVFLNQGNGRCRIHEQFGMAAKPVGCRLYPFHIVPTFPGTVSVSGRYDCPSIRGNQGQAFADQARDLQALATELELPGGFDATVMDLLSREQIEAVAEFAVTLLGAFAADDEKALFLHFLCEWIEAQQLDELGRETLGQAFEPLKQRVADALAAPPRRLGWVHRLAFRALLAQHLRRDEDVLDQRVGRWTRGMGITAFMLGAGGLRGLGTLHPPGQLRAARLFHAHAAVAPGFRPVSSPPVGATGVGTAIVAPGFRPVSSPGTIATGAMDLHWRMVKEKLGTFQFMGRGKIGRDFLTGLRAVALLYPLVLATAKCSAAGRGSDRIEAQDVDFAVPAVEYGYGRSAVLLSSMSRRLEVLLLECQAFVNLVRSI